MPEDPLPSGRGERVSQPAFTGVLSVLATPFEADGSLDLGSLIRLVEHNLAWGVDAVVCFGLAGELYKLTDPERSRVLATVVDTVAGEIPVIAGTEHTSTEGAVQRTRWAVDAGAAAVMVYPPSFVPPTADDIVDYYAALGDAVDVPIIVQDAPAWTGVPLPLPLLAAIRARCPSVTHVKVEAPPTSPKLAALPELGLRPIGGFGALHLAEELATGIDATMPGCALPGLYVDIMRAHNAGDVEHAWSLYSDALPLLTFQMGGLDVFVATQKHLLHRLGVLSTPALRRPGRQLTDSQLQWLDWLLECSQVQRYLTAPVT